MHIDGMLSTTGGTTLNGGAQHDSAVIRHKVHDQQGSLQQNSKLKDVVRSSGYLNPDKKVNVRICTEDNCRNLSVGSADTPSRQ
ncbi:hypothetical protein ACHPQR_005211, partial [Salmonella enterica subsp. enterica serovar Braenderup]